MNQLEKKNILIIDGKNIDDLPDKEANSLLEEIFSKYEKKMKEKKKKLKTDFDLIKIN